MCIAWRSMLSITEPCAFSAAALSCGHACHLNGIDHSGSEGIMAFMQHHQGIWTEEGRLKGLSFSPRATDLFIVTTPKAGTTWLQQMVHQLRTGGDMEFAEISEVVPHVELAHDTHQDLHAEQKAFPRCYKTHCWYDHCPKGGRYIVCLRDPCAVAYSFFCFLNGWAFQPGEVSLEEFIREFWLAHGVPQSKMQEPSYFHHLVSWWPHRNDPNVLLLFFEDLKEDLDSAVRAVAEFMGVNDEGHIQVALERSTFSFMKQHEDKFDEKLLKVFRNVALNLPKDAGMASSKVRVGSSSEGQKMLPEDIQREIQKKWETVVAPVTGCATYQELRRAWKEEKSKPK